MQLVKLLSHFHAEFQIDLIYTLEFPGKHIKIGSALSEILRLMQIRKYKVLFSLTLLSFFLSLSHSTLSLYPTVLSSK